MKRIALLALAATGALAAQAQPGYAPVPAPVAVPAQQAPSFVDRARVQDVQPQYETVQVPRQECSSQYVQDAPQVVGGERGYGGAIIGGVAGGILGNQVGKGHGKEAATAAGAVIGAITGDRLQNNQAPQQVVQAPPREVRSCRTVYDTQQRATGYRVTYEYRGNQYVTFTREQPGQSLPVRVSVTPLEEREYHRR
ncbi:glycine zipper 2TM domain-containing protein [Ramlibacter sp. USB13]|uniref:Glycine zipper 2TM domain-containing protein n=1 Tax=Ramlibacter cellulosilyticus TaxID=2764187 RepID=A0A923SD90_9BURK|nr:glycine zipper 2TM domain-containing protein [Ramlibacter cellulosilyticus]MBC5785083.1 glycine zipper 2TM domain-containing protein [Ramlibacter cellulosilyticus]